MYVNPGAFVQIFAKYVAYLAALRCGVTVHYR